MSDIAAPYLGETAPGMAGLYVDPRQNNRGIVPIFSTIILNGREQEIVRIKCAGDSLNVGAFPVDEVIQARFPAEYKAWKEGVDAVHAGTLLSDWNDLPDDIRERLEDEGIRTIDQLAAVSDANLNHVLEHDARLWRDRAIAKLAANRVDPERDMLKAALAALTAKMVKLEAQARPKKRLHRRVRPRPLPVAEPPWDAASDRSDA